MLKKNPKYYPSGPKALNEKVSNFIQTCHEGSWCTLRGLQSAEKKGVAPSQFIYCFQFVDVNDSGEQLGPGISSKYTQPLSSIYKSVWKIRQFCKMELELQTLSLSSPIRTTMAPYNTLFGILILVIPLVVAIRYLLVPT